MDTKSPNFSDPDCEPTDQQWSSILAKVALIARWRSAMADSGIKVLELDLSPREEVRRADEWAKQNEPADL